MCNMKLEKNELSLVILGMEALMEQLKDDGITKWFNYKGLTWISE